MPYPTYRQLDSMDCGPTCLRMIARHYGRSYSLQNLRERCHITREGVSMLGISDAAESIGLRATGVKITWEQLRDEMSLPCIVHWNQRHFVVVYEIRKRRGGYVVKVADPASGLLTYAEEAFCRAWLQAGKDNESVRTDVELNVTAAYLQILCDQENLASAREMASMLESQIERIQTMEDLGRVTEADLLQIRS